MTEEERECLKKEILESTGKFIVFERDGKAIISPLKDDTLTQEYQGEVLYSKNSEGRCNSFFEFIKNQQIQSVDELAKQVLPEIEDVERQDFVQNVINSQVNELYQAKEREE